MGYYYCSALEYDKASGKYCIEMVYVPPGSSRSKNKNLKKREKDFRKKLNSI